MEKIYILDTNVILHNPEAVFSFEDNKVIIPMTVIEEVDDQKKRQDSVGKNARIFSRRLDKLRREGVLAEGIQIESGGTLQTILNHKSPDVLPSGLNLDKADNVILATALNIKRENEKPVVLVSKDVNLRIKADALGLKAEDYETDVIQIDELYSGLREIEVTPEIIDNFFEHNKLECGELETEEKLYDNEFVNLTAGDQTNQSALARYDKKEEALVPFVFTPSNIWGISPRNREQRCAFEVLLNDDVKLVTLVGKAGTGKTLLALAAGLEKVVEEKVYEKLIVTRPVVPMGNDLGYLPGDIEEKIKPWMEPIYDNMEFLSKGSSSDSNQLLTDLKSMNLIELQAITYIRGRSIPDQFIIVDEAQNLTPHELKTIITRVGEGTKIVLTGDPYQIDHPYLDSDSNGLTYVAERMKDKKITGHITLKKGERSKLAELAAELL